jgi:hypothetical protein
LQAETIGVEVLQGRFQAYIEFLEEHEVVEDQVPSLLLQLYYKLHY